MLAIGKYHTLQIIREREQGVYLEDKDGNEVLLPNKYVPEDFKIYDSIKVFLYLDSAERIVATTLEPYATVDSFAYLKCTGLSEAGAFLDWGLEKDLFVPFKEQITNFRKESWYLVYVYLDTTTNRLLASGRTNRFLSNTKVTLAPYEKVHLIASHPSSSGWNMIVNQQHIGLAYANEIFQKLHVGDELSGFVKTVRPDGKIDLTLQQHGYRGIEPNALQILKVLKVEGGFLPLNDKSAPAQIEQKLQLSKKSFKRAIGTLYKSKSISIDADGIRLLEQSDS